MSRAALATGLLALLMAATCQAQPVNPERACVAQLASRPELQPLARKIWLAGARHQPFHFMMRADSIEPPERGIFTAWLRARHQCFARGQAWRERHGLALELALASWAQGRFVELSALLYAGELSSGEFAQARAELSMDAVFAAAQSATFLRQAAHEE